MDTVGLKGRLMLAARGIGADLNNFHLLHYRHIDGFLVTGKNSGTHLIKYMLSHAFAAEYGLPPPMFSSGRSSNDFVGHPKRPPKYENIPVIGSSHNLPSVLFACGPIPRMLALPPIVVLVRDIKEAMMSHHVKWRSENKLSLSDYVNVPPPGRRLVADVWWYMDFFNRWGRMAVRHPDHVLIVRYEDLVVAPRYWLERILRHYKLDLSVQAIDAGIRVSGRDTMRQRLDPNADELIIPADRVRNSAHYSREDEARLGDLLAEHLKFSFGYGYALGGKPIVAGPSVEPDSAEREKFSRLAG